MNDDDDFECGYQRNDHVEGEYVNPEFLMCMGIKDQRLLKNAKKKSKSKKCMYGFFYSIVSHEINIFVVIFLFIHSLILFRNLY